MNAIGLIMNLLLAGLMGSALVMGWRLNKRLKALRASHDGFAAAVHELDAAASRAAHALAALQAASGEATEELADRIEKGRALVARLDRLMDKAPVMAAAPAAPVGEAQNDASAERRLGALLAAAREARVGRREEAAEPVATTRTAPLSRPRPQLDDELFADVPLTLRASR